ncbi:hypothetical protein CkaCkLH20_02210 [Colletotrichum karsti]|uniref:Uncharacterized protein n=1 Tax=Colletotrichum karsti TaxID=1095194 RepID=A0A9P6IE79_9PEZI|nr:uncharacterized protein CkaCkLH20_02210 [Colletotrichum karsti]KAF9880256.1 hypothetical protein CkaCkLH20_02210 [Colletotrichum karsti]
MQSSSSIEYEKAQYTQQILDAWELLTLEDVVGPQLSPTTWSLSLLKNLAILCRQKTDHKDARRLLKAEIKRRLGNDPVNGVSHHAFLAAVDVQNLIETQETRRAGRSGTGRPRTSSPLPATLKQAKEAFMKPAPKRGNDNVSSKESASTGNAPRTPSPKAPREHTPRPAVAPSLASKLEVPLTPTSMSGTPVFVPNRVTADTAFPVSVKYSLRAAGGILERLKRKRDALLEDLESELESERKRVCLETNIAVSNVSMRRFELDLSVGQQRKAAEALASLPGEAQLLAKLERNQDLRNDLLEIQGRHADLLAQSPGQIDTYAVSRGSTGDDASSAQNTVGGAFDLLFRCVESKIAAIEMEVTEARDMQRSVQEELEKCSAVVRSKAEALDAAERTHAGLIADSESLATAQTGL